MEEHLLASKHLLRHEQVEVTTESLEIAATVNTFNNETVLGDVETNQRPQSFISHSVGNNHQPFHTLNHHLARLNSVLSDHSVPLPNDDDGTVKKSSHLNEFDLELKTITSLSPTVNTTTETHPSNNKKFQLLTEYFGPITSDSSDNKVPYSNNTSSKNSHYRSFNLTKELNDSGIAPEMRHALLDTSANFSNEKFCVVSQCFLPDSQFSKGFCVNHENLEMIKMSFPDMEDVEEYLDEFYDSHGLDKSLENVETELYICDAVYACIFNRQEYYFAKYRNLIKHYGTIDILQLRDKKESTRLSKKQFLQNCLWVFSMTILCLIFIALFCISIWITEGTNELTQLNANSTSRNSSILFPGTNSTIEHTLQTLPKWNYLSSFYFSAVTMLTIGYGDYSPITAAGQILVIVHAVFGIIWISFLISIIGKRLLQNINFVLYSISKTIERALRLVVSRTRLRYFLTSSIRKGFTNPLVQLVYFIIFMVVYCLVGASIFLSLERGMDENWTFLRSLYFTIISLTTIGYGDVFVKRRLFFLYPST